MRQIGSGYRPTRTRTGRDRHRSGPTTGLAQELYSDYINGKSEPDLLTLARIRRELGTTPDEALGFREGKRDWGNKTRVRIDAPFDMFGQRQMKLAYGLLT